MVNMQSFWTIVQALLKPSKEMVNHLKIRLIAPESAKNTYTIAGVASMGTAREVFSQVGCEQLREKEITQLEFNPDALNGRDFLIINKINEIIKTVNDLSLRVEP